MSASARIYGGGAIAFGGMPVVNDLKAAGYDTVIVWSVHVNLSQHVSNGITYYPGDLILNDTRIVSQGVYAEQTPMNLPTNLAALRGGGAVQIIFSVGSGGVTDWGTIETLMGGSVPGPGNVLYDNFQALKNAMAAVTGGDIDAVDFDNEDNIQIDVMVDFGRMLAAIGYGHVTLCPYSPPYDWGSQEDPTTVIWISTLQQLDAAVGAGFVSAIHLQCYSGGGGNAQSGYVAQWIGLVNAAMPPGFDGAALMIPGLSTAGNQLGSGWWDGNASPPGPGACVKQQPGVAQYEHSDWSGYLFKMSNTTPDAAMQAAQANGAVTFFFYCNGFLMLEKGTFEPGDAVFFTGAPWWGSAPQADAYYLGCNCSGSLNEGLAQSGCPADLQAQYAAWKQQGGTGAVPAGGFIWLYDSVMNCLTSGCCGGTFDHPAVDAAAYAAAITNGLA
ncbi:MAG TPA: hypothetical protein VK610_07710 [Rhodothermales bacterium]|nr:hypothetical protein [Rhodothermales bacterium]